jgi:hypothetical protein
VRPTRIDGFGWILELRDLSFGQNTCVFHFGFFIWLGISIDTVRGVGADGEFGFWFDFLVACLERKDELVSFK